MSRPMWDTRYAEPGFAYGREPNDFLRSVIELLPSSGRALCLAEGEGRNAVFLAQRGLDVTAVDQSEVGLAKARTLAGEVGVELHTVEADLADFVIEEGAYAIIAAIWCHVPQPLRSRLHRAAVAGLAEGGAFVLEAYTPEQVGRGTGGPPTAELMVGLDELRRDLAGLRLDHADELVREVHEGRFHNGDSAVVQVLGFRTQR